MKFKEKLINFMYGRNGMDQFGKALLWFSVGLACINLFFHSLILYIAAYAFFGWEIFRILSKNVVKRRIENDGFVRIWYKTKKHFTVQRNRIRYYKIYKYCMCPGCKAVIRVPRKKKTSMGVSCPGCGRHFEVKM